MNLQQGLDTLLVVAIVAAAAPLLSGLIPQGRVPQVVVLIVGGILVGPQILGWTEPASLELLSNLGLGFLFLLAGYELELHLFRERPGRLALVAWLVTVAVAVLVTGVLEAVGFVRTFVPIALGLTTTALGTLLPILRDGGMLTGRLAPYILSAGAVGEFLPVLGIAVLLSANGRLLGLLSLLCVGAVAALLTVAPRLVRGERIRRVFWEREHATSQTTLRCTILLLLILLAIASDFGLDVVLGAFLAGVVLRRWAPGEVHLLESKLDAIGYGFFIPIFFVSSGMGLDVDSIVEAPARLLVFLLLLVAVRGLPALIIYRHDLATTQRIQMTLLTATALPLLVALSQIGLTTGQLLPENAAALVGAGVLSVMIFPGVALALDRRTGRESTGTTLPPSVH
ncbi:MAG: cation:proton antiporter [Nocardioidaceae bacterium]|nr:cation:proton antiporter [Nocardioidaceae bacterium]